jgi:hypothetical protein
MLSILYVILSMSIKMQLRHKYNKNVQKIPLLSSI